MITFPNAKINLGLNIVEKRADGYHNLETIFYPIPLKDIIEIKELKSDTLPYTFHQKGINIEGEKEDNLVIKAYKLLKQKYKLPPIEIHLHKNIPAGAGMGGGSADAAFMLKLLNQYFNLNIPTTELIKMAASLGADCAFFIENRPTYATGIGDLFTPINLDLTGYDLYIHKPDVFISTAEAFANITPKPALYDLKEIIKQPIKEWRGKMINDFEESILKNRPELAAIKEQLYREGALYAAMSGSGSSLFGLFERGGCKLPCNKEKGTFLFQL